MEQFAYPISERLRALAMTFPETSEGSSCVNRAFKVRKKNFLFIGEKEDHVRLMLKLTDSKEAAAAMEDERIGVGGIGWVTLRFAPDQPLDEALLAAWITESFTAMAPKTVLKAWRARST